MAKLESDTTQWFLVMNPSILDQVCQEITGHYLVQAEERTLHVIGEHDDYSVHV